MTISLLSINSKKLFDKSIRYIIHIVNKAEDSDLKLIFITILAKSPYIKKK
jgi:hypothetical protein